MKAEQDVSRRDASDIILLQAYQVLQRKTFKWLSLKLKYVQKNGAKPVGQLRQTKNIYDEHSYSKLRANCTEASLHGLLILDLVGHQAHLPLII